MNSDARPFAAEQSDRGTAAVSWLRVAADYGQLMKPGITGMNLLPTFAAFWVATGGQTAGGQLWALLLGTACSVASGAVLNMWAERDRDRLMARTRNRPLPDGRISPAAALLYGLLLGTVGITVLAVWVHLTAAAIALFGIVFYAGVYTLLLKPNTHWNTVLGAVTGAVPPMIGWVAGSGGLNAMGLTIAGIVFFWQPVHFWALALTYAKEYRAAGIRVLPNTHGRKATDRQILSYAVLLVLISASVFWQGIAGPYYLAASLLLGGLILALASGNLKDPGLGTAKRLFHVSNGYLAVLFLLLIFDCRC